MVAKIIRGIKATESKKNHKMGYTYFFEEPFSDYESANSVCLGFKVGAEFSYNKFDVKPGDSVNFYYDKGYEDKAMLVDMVPVRKG